MDIFEICQEVNDMLRNNNETSARNQLIQLLDYLTSHNIPYPAVVNHLIRVTGLYPYLQLETSDWQEQFVYNAFKVDTGDKNPITLHREQSSLLNSS